MSRDKPNTMWTAGAEIADAPRPVVWACWRLRVVSMLLFLLSASWTAPAHAQQDYTDREAKIKAAYLYKFINYVQWPDTAFADEQAPLVLGTLGDDPVNGYLRLIAKKRNAGARRLVYLSVNRPEQATSCHLLFVAGGVEEETFASILPHLQNKPVLLVGERPEFAETVGVIEFIIVGNNVRLQVSLKAAKQRDLKVSSQLAKLAEIVN